MFPSALACLSLPHLHQLWGFRSLLCLPSALASQVSHKNLSHLLTEDMCLIRPSQLLSLQLLTFVSHFSLPSSHPRFPSLPVAQAALQDQHPLLCPCPQGGQQPLLSLGKRTNHIAQTAFVTTSRLFTNVVLLQVMLSTLTR